MKFFSDVLNKTFDTAEECETAETEYQEQKERADAELAEKKSAMSKRKKELSNAIESAKEEVSDAYEAFDKANAQAKQIVRDAEETARALVNDAAKVVTEKEEAYAAQVKAFSEEFGSYSTTLTGKSAEREYNKIVKRFSSLFDLPFHFFF